MAQRHGVKKMRQQKSSAVTTAEPSPSVEALLKNVKIPDEKDVLSRGCKELQGAIEQGISTLLIDLSRALGAVIELGDPNLEDFTGFAIARLKFLKQRVATLPADPFALFRLKKLGKAPTNMSSKDEQHMLAQVYMLDAMLANGTKRIAAMVWNFQSLLESSDGGAAATLAETIREELRLATRLVYDRESVSPDAPLLSKDQVRHFDKKQQGIKAMQDLLSESIDLPANDAKIKDFVLKVTARIDQGETNVDGNSIELHDAMPLFSLFQLVRDELPDINVKIEDVERVATELGAAGYIPGITVLEDDDGRSLKVVQFKARDYSKDEQRVVSTGHGLKKFTLADMVSTTGLDLDYVEEIVRSLEKNGIFRHSKSLLEGECWYA
jgi:hypothetical protein